MSDSDSLGSVQVSLTPRDRFVEFLQSRGMRVTAQRLALVDHVFSHHEHFDADQLMEQLPKSGQSGHVSRPTVYRTLAEFVDAYWLVAFDGKSDECLKQTWEGQAYGGLIARTFGLTPAELRVLLAIVDVGGVPESSEKLGVAETTIKTHLKQVFAKTGANRQADLVKLIAGFSFPLAE